MQIIQNLQIYEWNNENQTNLYVISFRNMAYLLINVHINTS